MLAVLCLLATGSVLADEYVPYEYQVEQQRSLLERELAKIPAEQRADHVRRQLNALQPPAPSTPSADSKIARPVQSALRPDPRIVVLKEWLQNHQSPISTPTVRPEGFTVPPTGDWNYPIALVFVAAGALLAVRRRLARDEARPRPSQ
jgi:hypothetical protein